MRKLLFLFVLWNSAASPAKATTIDPRIWQQLVADADFVGIVECVTAGGIVAEYEVVEPWKGAGAGERFRLRIAVNYWEPQYPVALVGERYLITAFRSAPPSRMLSTTSGGGVPLWARELPADYRLPLFQGRARIPLDGEGHALFGLGTDETDLERFKAAVKKLLDASPEERELALLKALADKYLGGWHDPDPPPAVLGEVAREVEAATNVEGALRSLRRLRESQERRLSYSYDAVVSQGGGAISLALGVPDEVSLVIRARLGQIDDPAPTPPSEPPSDVDVDALDIDSDFGLLTRLRPDRVAVYLKNWTNPDDGWSSADRGYVLGSFFAILVESERARHLESMLDANDPFVRVAGAVYLALEDPEERGLRYLRELQTLDGDSGVWAALALARRGDASVVPRLLRVFDETGPSNMAGVPHRNLQKRILVLLSNSAAASGLPQPLSSGAANSARLHRELSDVRTELGEWWEREGDRVRLVDPWLEELRSKRVD